MASGKLLGLVIAVSLAVTGGAAGGVVKTKTKSNQSNDRCGGPCPVLRDEVSATLEAEFDRLDADKDGQLGSSEQGGIAVSSAGGETARGAPLKGVDVRFGYQASTAVRITFSPALDRNGDGLVSRAEWLADGLAQFDLADEDQDHSLTATEAARFGWNIKSSETR